MQACCDPDQALSPGGAEVAKIAAEIRKVGPCPPSTGAGGADPRLRSFC